MRAKATLVMVDEQPTFLLDDGSIIDSDKIGYICSHYGLSAEDCYYDKFTKDDVSFIINNKVDCEIEMMDEFSNPEEFGNSGLYDGERMPKLYKGKVIIHFK